MKDLTFQRFGRLVAYHVDSPHIQPSGQKKTKWKCLCDCGNVVSVMLSNLIKPGHTTSCGCFSLEVTTKHGQSGAKAYNSYYHMKGRCYNPSEAGYENYGGRGIKVSERWLESFQNFFDDMGECPEGCSLERIDVNGDYCKENCKWENYSNQAYNQRMSKYNTSGRTGVCWHKAANKWSASIDHMNKQIHLGLFETYDGAVAARERAELTYFGRNKQ